MGQLSSVSFSEPTVSPKSSQEMQILKFSPMSKARVFGGGTQVFPRDRRGLREKAWNEGKDSLLMIKPRRPGVAVD